MSKIHLHGAAHGPGHESHDPDPPVEVIPATSLFLYGIAGVPRNMTLKLGALASGGAIFLFSVILLLTG